MAETKAVQQITDADFDSILSAGKPVFIDFWAPWCGPCRIVGPIVEELAPTYEGKAVIAKMNVDENPEIAGRFGVTSIPTMMMFKEGKLVDRMVGAAPTMRSTSFPFLNIISVGIEVTPNFCATIGLSSTFILAMTALPS